MERIRTDFAETRPDFLARVWDIARAGIRDRLVLTVSAFAFISLCLFPAHTLSLLSIYGSLLPGPIVLLVLILCVIAIRTTPSTPLSMLVERLRAVPLRFYTTLVSIALFLSAFTACKIHIPAITPFYADPWIADLDFWLHGTDPWRVARALPEFASLFVDVLYSQIWFVVAFGCILHASVFASGAEFRRLAWASLFVYLVLGVAFATLFSSVGPVFYDLYYPGGRFHELIAELEGDIHAAGQKAYMNHLYHAAQSGNVVIGSGISAMPSVHVAVAFVSAWYLTSRGFLLASAGWVFAFAILVGSVYTGWHYAVDGYVSAILATLSWLVLSRRFALPVLVRAG